jgi:hypothetical protein
MSMNCLNPPELPHYGPAENPEISEALKNYPMIQLRVTIADEAEIQFQNGQE